MRRTFTTRLLQYHYHYNSYHYTVTNTATIIYYAILPLHCYYYAIPALLHCQYNIIATAAASAGWTLVSYNIV